MLIEVETNPNSESSIFARFNELGPRREVIQIRTYDRKPDGEWCWVTGWTDDPVEPHMVIDPAGIDHGFYRWAWDSVVHVSGNRSEISGMFHGQADEIVRQFRRLTAEQAAAPATWAPADDPRLGEFLREYEQSPNVPEPGASCSGAVDQTQEEVEAALSDETDARRN
jgi:hypothetical protein